MFIHIISHIVLDTLFFLIHILNFCNDIAKSAVNNNRTVDTIGPHNELHQQQLQRRIFLKIFLSQNVFSWVKSRGSRDASLE